MNETLRIYALTVALAISPMASATAPDGPEIPGGTEAMSPKTAEACATDTCFNYVNQLPLTTNPKSCDRTIQADASNQIMAGKGTPQLEDNGVLERNTPATDPGEG